MPRFATGKNAYGISDRSGMKYRHRDLKKEWNGSLVGPDEFEAKHPQLGSTSDTVRFRSVYGFDGFTKAVLEQSAGYSITVVTTDTYTFTANGETATIGGIVGGGSRATAGPTTVSA